MKTLYVRVQPKKLGVASFFRCGMNFTQAWSTLQEVDAATASRLESEQMLEVTETRPAELDEAAPAGDSAAGLVVIPAGDAGGPASAPALESVGEQVAEGALALDGALGGKVADVAEMPEESAPPADSASAVPSAVYPDAPTKPEDPAAVIDAVKAAVAQLDQANADLFTAGGKPKTDVLAALTGWPVTASERDAAVGE